MTVTKQISNFFTNLVYSTNYQYSSLFINNEWKLRIEQGNIAEVDFGYFIPDTKANKIEENISRYYDNIIFFNEYLPKIIDKFHNFNFEIDLRFNHLGLIDEEQFNIRGIYYFKDKDFFSINQFFKLLQEEQPGIFNHKNTLQIFCRGKQFVTFKFTYSFIPDHEDPPLENFIISNNSHQIGVIYNKAKQTGLCDFLLEINKEGQISCYKMKQLVKYKKEKGVV